MGCHAPMQQTLDDGPVCPHGPGLDNVAYLLQEGGGTPIGLQENGSYETPLWQVTLPACVRVVAETWSA